MRSVARPRRLTADIRSSVIEERSRKPHPRRAREKGSAAARASRQDAVLDVSTDSGWHLDGSYSMGDDPWPWVNLRSQERALLMLFLLSDVGPDDAPTRIKVGSHLDVPPFLAPAGEKGMSMLALCQSMDRAGKLD